MAIGRTIRPVVILAGHVVGVRELRRKADQSIYGHRVTVKQSNDAEAEFTVYDRPDAPTGLPAIGEFVAAECSVEESRDFGTSLNFERHAYDALDVIQSNLGAAA